MRPFGRRQLVAWERQRPAGMKGGYGQFVARMSALRDQHMREWRNRTPERAFGPNDVLAAYDSLPPKEFAQAYDLPDEAFDGSLATVQKKYLLRFKNIRRAWSRLLCYLPEAMSGEDRYSVLEMSTAHGAVLEVLRHFGHEVTGSDYSNDYLRGKRDARTPFRDLGDDLADGSVDRGDWPYRPIIDSLGLNVVTFDAGIIPYPFKQNAFDIVLCFDALEHYCHPKHWIRVVDEFVRLSRRTVVVEINPIRRELVEDEGYVGPVRNFYDQMRGYRKDGFRCVGTGTSFNQPRFFKLMNVA